MAHTVGGAVAARLTVLAVGGWDATLVLVGGYEVQQLALTRRKFVHTHSLLNARIGVKGSAEQMRSPSTDQTVFHLPMPTLGILFRSVLFTISLRTIAPPSISISSARPSVLESFRRMRSGRM